MVPQKNLTASQGIFQNRFEVLSLSPFQNSRCLQSEQCLCLPYWDIQEYLDFFPSKCRLQGNSNINSDLLTPELPEFTLKANASKYRSRYRRGIWTFCPWISSVFLQPQCLTTGQTSTFLLTVSLFGSFPGPKWTPSSSFQDRKLFCDIFPCFGLTLMKSQL